MKEGYLGVVAWWSLKMNMIAVVAKTWHAMGMNKFQSFWTNWTFAHERMILGGCCIVIFENELEKIIHMINFFGVNEYYSDMYVCCGDLWNAMRINSLETFWTTKLCTHLLWPNNLKNIDNFTFFISSTYVLKSQCMITHAREILDWSVPCTCSVYHMALCKLHFDLWSLLLYYMQIYL